MRKILLAAALIGTAWGASSCSRNGFCRASLPPRHHLTAPESTPRYYFRHGPRQVPTATQVAVRTSPAAVEAE